MELRRGEGVGKEKAEGGGEEMEDSNDAQLFIFQRSHLMAQQLLPQAGLDVTAADGGDNEGGECERCGR